MIRLGFVIADNRFRAARHGIVADAVQGLLSELMDARQAKNEDLEADAYEIRLRAERRFGEIDNGGGNDPQADQK
jgi:hypothetical protein